MRLRTGRRPLCVIPEGGNSSLEVSYKQMFARRLEGQTSAPVPAVHGALDRCRAFFWPSLSTKHVNQVNKAPRRAYRMGPGRSGERGGR